MDEKICSTCGKEYIDNHECSADDLEQAALALEDYGQPASQMWLDCLSKLEEERPING